MLDIFFGALPAGTSPRGVRLFCGCTDSHMSDCVHCPWVYFSVWVVRKKTNQEGRDGNRRRLAGSKSPTTALEHSAVHFVSVQPENPWNVWLHYNMCIHICCTCLSEDPCVLFMKIQRALGLSSFFSSVSWKHNSGIKHRWSYFEANEAPSRIVGF